MKDVGYHEFEADHPSPLTPRVARNRVVECLDLLHCDEVHKMGDNVSYGLTYENLIGALTDAKRALVAWEYRDKFAWWVRLIKDGVMQKPTAEFMLMVVMECEFVYGTSIYSRAASMLPDADTNPDWDGIKEILVDGIKVITVKTEKDDE